MRDFILKAVVVLAVTGSLAHAEPSMNLKDLPADQDSTITIRKGDRHRPLDPDVEVNSGTEEISGDPLAGLKESHDSWKKACDEWKKEMREMNGPALISLNCGTPHPERDSSSRVTQTSVGTYKLKIRVREAR
jgi:hypothetical protein